MSSTLMRTGARRVAAVAASRAAASALLRAAPRALLSYKVDAKSGEYTGLTDNIHRSNAEKLINEVAPIEVDSAVAVCDGGGGALGHPLEYIQLNTTTPGKAETCIYCGLRYKMKAHH
mmetsp:Transcript_19433/g.49067  ORF Transcript_19433/g.49067 Transcript_19433/m.49067 type:complete len:118 (-) Transcript_19433:76-429(-)